MVTVYVITILSDPKNNQREPRKIRGYTYLVEWLLYCYPENNWFLVLNTKNVVYQGFLSYQSWILVSQTNIKKQNFDDNQRSKWI